MEKIVITSTKDLPLIVYKQCFKIEKYNTYFVDSG